MSVRSFGFNEEGKEILLYTLENENLSVSVMNYGATMVSIVEKKTGIDVLLGFDSAEEYIAHPAHLGAFIGRTANRTKDAKFVLNGETYHIDKNSGNNNLHGGSHALDRTMYDVEETETTLKFHRLSPDGEMGYPGDLDVTVTYTLLEDGVELKAEGKALNKDTLFAMTNHNYYNLDGTDSILTHRVTIPAEMYADDSEDGISQLPLRSVENTPFDFRTEKELGRDIDADNVQVQMNHGFDHHWAVDGTGMRTFAVCRGEKVQLTVCSAMPGMHMYTSNFLEGVGKKGMVYHRHSAVCFEPEYIPNAINYEGVVQPIVRAGETSVQIIELHLCAI